MRIRTGLAVVLFLLRAAAGHTQTPLGTAFTYQGRLADGGSPAGGTYDLRFILFDASVGGLQVGPSSRPTASKLLLKLFGVALEPRLERHRGWR